MNTSNLSDALEREQRHQIASADFLEKVRLMRALTKRGRLIVELAEGGGYWAELGKRRGAWGPTFIRVLEALELATREMGPA